jgi:succinate dehydrogenase / fumarate reductase, flavoprotein subunit
LAGFNRNDGENPFAIQKDLQEMMQDLVGIVRTEDEMRQAKEGIAKLRERREKIALTGNIDFNPSWHTSLDLHNLLNVSEAITLAAIERKESRGGQFREDFPTKSPEFGKVNFVIKKGVGGEMEIRSEPIPEMPDELKQIIEEMG